MTGRAPAEDGIDIGSLTDLVRQFQASDLNELYVASGAFELFLSNIPGAQAPWKAALATSAAGGIAPPVPRAGAAIGELPGIPSPATPGDPDIPAGLSVIYAPYLGTFYRAPKPGEPNFVEIGDRVEADAELCLVEVMKLFTAVRTDAPGIVRQVYAVDGEMVHDGQPLFALQPLS